MRSARPPLLAGPGSEVQRVQANALSSAIVFRDCSFRPDSTRDERRACRTLMRAEALRWRHPSRGNGW